MAEVTVADAGPLIALARVEQLLLLEQRFKQVLITQAVAAELQLEQRAQNFDVQHLQSAVAAGWLRTHNVAMRAAGYSLSDAVLDSVARHTAKSSTP